jgi:hypothetical protein
MPALVAGIHVLLFAFLKEVVDGRDKPGHDVESVSIPIEASVNCFGSSAAPMYYGCSFGLMPSSCAILAIWSR